MQPEFSDRQIECLRLVANGTTSSKAISAVTGLSPGSVDNYLSRAAVALDVTDRRAAAERFVELERLLEQNSVSRSVSRFLALFRAVTIGERSIAAGVRWLLKVPPIGGPRHHFNRIEITVSIFKVAAVCFMILLSLVLAGAGILWVFR